MISSLSSHSRRLPWIFCVLPTALTASWWLASVASAQTIDTKSRPNAVVLSVAEAVPNKGGYNTKWTGSGTPFAISHGGKEILAKGNKTYCNGFSFAVVMRSADKLGALNNKSVKQVRTFQRMWYGGYELEKAKTDVERKWMEDVRERQLQAAIPKLGIGYAVLVQDAEPGDFVQFWRVKSGHSAVFLGWITEDNPDNGEPMVVGLRYRSSQKSTEGVGDKVERFRGQGGDVNPKRMYFARLERM